MTRTLRVLFLLLLGVCLPYCDSGGNGSDSQTNWVRTCTHDADCSAPDTCRCGICTTGCSSSDDCTGSPAPAACIEVTSAADGGRCRLSKNAPPGLCLPTCTAGASCPGSGSLECTAGVCMPRLAGAIDGGGGPSGTAGNDAGAGGGDRSNGGASGREAGTASASGNGGHQGDAGPLRAPRPGEAQQNPYGKPIGVNEDFNPDNGCSPSSSVGWDSTDTACLVYWYCELKCTHDEDCPSGGSGDAPPVCDTYYNACALSCADGERCPPGMVCRTQQPFPVFATPKCYWEADSTVRGCPAHCLLDPIPHDCPNYCAILGVACDPTKGVECCSGLTCGSGRFCESGG
jgi:hypothetical protein